MIRVSASFLVAVVLIVVACAQHEKSKPHSVSGDYVPDKATAIKIAEAIWLPIYGEGIYKKKPFIAKLKDSKVWIVEGSLPPNTYGGVPYIEIQKKDCKVLRVSHGK